MAQNEKELNPATRLTTGVGGLDTLLNGGFIRGGMYLLMGPPGGGKTVLGNQICYHHVKEHSGSVIYITLLTESHIRMLENLRPFNFFNDEWVGRSIHYLSGYHALEKDGLKGLMTQIAGEVRERKATLLIIDGISMFADIDHSALAFRRFTHDLNSYLATSGCTALLLSAAEGPNSKPEHTMVDGIIALHHENVGLRSLRQIEVRKFRGSNHLQGKHYFSISDEGMHVVPRIESLNPTLRFQASPQIKERLVFGISGLDEMLGGGVIANSITTLIGAAGTGKTVLGLHFLQAGARRGEQGLYFGFYETPDDLLEKAGALELDVHKWVEKGTIEILWHPALEQELDELGESLLQAVRRSKVKRVVIDGVDGFRYSATDQQRINRFFVALVLKLKAEGVTVLLVEEISFFSGSQQRQVAELSALNETLLYLRNLDFGSRMMRVISILKIRSAVYDASVREFRIDQSGVKVLGAVSSLDGVMTSEARRGHRSDLDGKRLNHGSEES
jgi:circadian clock protein KaiC